MCFDHQLQNTEQSSQPRRRSTPLPVLILKQNITESSWKFVFVATQQFSTFYHVFYSQLIISNHYFTDHVKYRIKLFMKLFDPRR